MENPSLLPALQVICLILLVCVCAVLLFYENEERSLQSSVEGLWIRVNDAGNAIGSLLAAFLAEAAKLTSKGIDRIFGPALVSKQAIGVASAYGFASMLITAWVASDTHSGQAWIAVAAFIFIGSLPAIAQSTDAARKVFLVPAAFGVFLLGMGIWHACTLIVAPGSLQEGTAMLAVIYVFFAAMIATVFVDVLWILLVRSMLKWFAMRQSPLRSVALLSINALALAASLIPVIEYDTLIATVHGGSFNAWLAFFLICLSSTRLFMLVTAFLFAWLLVVLLLHRISWPLLDRVIYAAARYKLVQNKKALLSLASALLVAGAWKSKPLLAVLAFLGLLHR